MWLNGTTDGYTWEAKVYQVGSKWGLNGGRVSKLVVCGEDGNAVYHYNRELKFDRAPAGLIDKILSQWN